MNNIFSIHRTIKLIRKDMLSEYKNLIIWILSSAGVMITISALNILIQKFQGIDVVRNSHFHQIFYIILLFPGGFLLTSSMFKDLHDKSKNIYWLTLPGSTLEKMISRLLISSLFYAFLLTIIYPLFAACSELFNLAVFGIRHDFFNPFAKDMLNLIPYYLVTQSIFFAGACYFRKHSFAKTLLSLALFQIIISLFAVILLRLFFGQYFSSIQNLDFNNVDIMNFTGYSAESFEKYIQIISKGAKILFWIILTPFFYVLSYFKLSEKEVRDGF